MSYDYFIENFKNTLCMDSLSIVSFRYRNSLQQVFKMSSLRANTRLQTLSPLADSSVNNTLLQTAPNVNQSPLELVDIVDLHLVHTLLHDPPNLVINGVQVRTVGGHSFREMKSAVSRCRSSTLLLYIITFLISQDSAETLFRGGGKINHLSIA